MQKLQSLIKRSKKKILIVALITASIIPISFTNNYFEVSKNLDIFATLYKELNTYYVDEIDASKLMRTGIDAMLESLDPYTNYISEAEIESYRFQTTGKYGGIGATIRKLDEYVVIVEPYEGFPAFKAGLRAGDKIVEIDGKSAKDKDTDDVSKALKGQPGTNVEVLIERTGTEERILKTLTREEVQVNSVQFAGMVNDEVGYIKLRSFTEKAGSDVEKAVKDLKENHGMKALIFDLRGNPGGLLNEAVNVTNVFIPKGEIVVNTKGKIDDWDKAYRTLNQPIDTEMPLVVLTSRSSASASEIVSGAIQDLDRGLVIGQKTFGKGLVQTTRPLSYNSQLKVTTAKYYIPSGRCIQAVDYSHRNEDGSLTKVPDSLREEYETRSGRTVYGGGGIDPDIELDDREYGKITISLITKQHIFEYANKFRNTHDEIPPAKDFKLSDEDFEELVAYLSDKEYDYTTKSEQALEDLKAIASKEKYFSAIEDEFERMKESMMHDKKKDLYKYKDEISEFLEGEIASRYYYQDGRVKASFDDDPEILKSLEVLNSMELYHQLLKPEPEN